MPFSIICQGIAEMKIDAICNAANKELAMRRGVCCAAFQGADRDDSVSGRVLVEKLLFSVSRVNKSTQRVFPAESLKEYREVPLRILPLISIYQSA